MHFCRNKLECRVGKVYNAVLKVKVRVGAHKTKIRLFELQCTTFGPLLRLRPDFDGTSSEAAVPYDK